MRIVFFGTGKFAVPTLKKLMDSGHEVVAVVTRPDRKKGRGWSVQPTLVKEFISQSSAGTRVLQPEKASEEGFLNSLRGMDADVFVIVDYGWFLKKDLLEIPRKYCVNLHPSLLPKYRGAAPVNWAILNGESEIGNTVLTVTERMDAGSMIMQERTDIGEDENAVTLSERLSRSGAELMFKALEAIEAGKEELKEQDENAVVLAPKLEKDEGRIDWTRSTTEIIRKIRGMQPWPGAFSYLGGRMLKILEAETGDDEDCSGTPGTVCDEKRFIVSTGKGTIYVNVVQVEGKKAMTSDEFLRGHHIKKGTILGR